MASKAFRFTTLAGLGLAAALAASASMADDIKYRQAVMKSIGGHMGSMGQIAKGEVPHKAHLLVHARAIEASLDLVKDAFQPKTSGGETTALEKIWTDWDGFAGKANDAAKAANVLVRTIENNGDVGAALKKLGATCGGCHKNYREKKKKM